MKHIPYRQNPTVIDTSKKSPTTAGENHAHKYELSNHLNTAYNTFALVRFLRTGAFYIFKNFSQNLSKSLANFRRVELRGTKCQSDRTSRKRDGERIQRGHRRKVSTTSSAGGLL